MKIKNLDFVGLWHIYEMETWDEEYFNEEVRAFIKINSDKTGEFHFGYVQAQMDGKIKKTSEGEVFEFTFDGNAEFDPAQGRGWIKIKEDNKKIIEGEFFFHMGDSSKFLARSVEK